MPARPPTTSRRRCGISRIAQNLGPYVPASAIEQDLLDTEEFAGVFSSDYLAAMGDVARFGETAFGGQDVDQGVPPTSLLA